MSHGAILSDEWATISRDKVAATVELHAATLSRKGYIPLHGPDRTRTDFFAARISEKLRWVRAGPCWSARVRAGPRSGILP